MKRKAEDILGRWFSSQKRKPLIVRGARQVGKSTLIRQFAQNMDQDLLEINLEQHSSPFIWESMQADTICKEIEFALNQRFTEKTILFIDEIQACPQAIQALRYIAEGRPEVPVIAAGSLLEFVLSDTNFSMPVGRIDYLYLGPMSFIEVLKARNEDLLVEALTTFSDTNKLSSSAHQRLQEYYLDFLFTGGMPEAVAASIEEKSIQAAKTIHRSIVYTYEDDFGKYKTKVSPDVIRTVFNYIPLHLGEKLKYVNISREIRANVLKDAIDCLTHAKVILPVYHNQCSGLPLKAGRNLDVRKFYFLDVGLASYIAGTDWMDMRQDKTVLINKGNISEQFVAQHLVYRFHGYERPELDYWLREGKSTNAELDFVISGNSQFIPIEVKAAKTGSLRSLHQFICKTGCAMAYRLDMNLPSKQKVEMSIQTTDGQRKVVYELQSIPAYLVESSFLR
jgi:predicted AAA+ superfamily ATPase